MCRMYLNGMQEMAARERLVLVYRENASSNDTILLTVGSAISFVRLENFIQQNSIPSCWQVPDNWEG